MQISPYKFGKFEASVESQSPPLDLDYLAYVNPSILHKHFMKFFLEIGYYMCIFPFKIVQSANGSYKIKRCRIQQVMCAVVYLSALLDTITFSREIKFDSVSENPKLYFNILTSFLHSCTVGTAAYSVWKNAERFCGLVRAVQMCPILSLWYSKRISTIVSLLVLMYVVLALINPILKEGGGESTWQGLFKYHAYRGRFILALQDKQSPTSPTEEQTQTAIMINFTWKNYLFALLSYFLDTSQWIVIYHVDLLMIVMSLTLYHAAKHFTDTLKKETDCKNAVRNYEALKDLSNQINSAIGAVTLVYTVDSILYYSTQLEILFTEKNWFHKMIVIQFISGSATWLHLASNACLQMDRFREWVRRKDKRHFLPSKTISVMMLLDEIATNPVGLSGNGLFMINYNFVAQALSALMTYFIIVIQFK